MSTITARFGEGGANLNPNKSVGSPSLAQALRDVADDFTAIRDAFVGLTAKLDADVGINDTDYASILDPAALLTIKG